jgi:hypothetical protein
MGALLASFLPFSAWRRKHNLCQNAFAARLVKPRRCCVARLPAA